MRGCSRQQRFRKLGLMKMQHFWKRGRLYLQGEEKGGERNMAERREGDMVKYKAEKQGCGGAWSNNQHKAE